jgi:hypothetical protein
MNALGNKRIDEVSATGNDDMVRASTLFDSMDRLRGTARHQVVNGEDQFQASTGQWFTQRQIEEGGRTFNTLGDRQAAYRYMMSKTLNEAPERQELVAEDFTDFANASGLTSDAASGAWAGVAIPNQRMRADMRFANFGGGRGQLAYHKNDAAHLDMMGTDTGFSLASQQEGTFESMIPAVEGQHQAFIAAQAALAHAQATGNVEEAQRQVAEMTRIQNRVANAHGNLKKFVGEARTGQPAVLDDEGNPVPGAGGYGGASSASWKTEQAARQALTEIEARFGDLRDNQDAFSGGSHSSADNR